MRCWFYIYFKIEREISFKSFKLYSLLLSEIFEIDGFLNNQNGRNFFSIAPNGLKFCTHLVNIRNSMHAKFQPFRGNRKKVMAVLIV